MIQNDGLYPSDDVIRGSDMDLIKSSAVTFELLSDSQNSKPLIICMDSARVQKKIIDAGYQDVHINAALAKALLEYKQADRPKWVENALKKLLDYHTPIYISNFEMLFDPRYEIDVLKVFCEKARTINVAVKWPGRYNDGKLTYVQPEDPDYHEFDCNSYQIRIVQ